MHKGRRQSTLLGSAFPGGCPSLTHHQVLASAGSWAQLERSVATASSSRVGMVGLGPPQGPWKTPGSKGFQSRGSWKKPEAKRIDRGNAEAKPRGCAGESHIPDPPFCPLTPKEIQPLSVNPVDGQVGFGPHFRTFPTGKH